MELPIGISAWVSAPITYQVKYLDFETRTYTETFACIQCSKEYVEKAGNTLAKALETLTSQIEKIPYVGSVLAAIVDFGALWYAYASLNSDGSVTFQFAYHYCGTKAGGIDLTAVPLPGVKPDTWNGIVNNLTSGIRMISGTKIRSFSADSKKISDKLIGNAPKGKPQK